MESGTFDGCVGHEFLHLLTGHFFELPVLTKILLLPPVTNMDALGSKANLASSCRANSERDWICFMFLSLMGKLFFCSGCNLQ